MLDASTRSEGLFADHFVNLRVPHASDVIAAQLRETGLVTLDGMATRQEVLSFASPLMAITPHPHGAPDGLTLIHNTGSHAHRAGFAGLGNGELLPHTERSGTPSPPRLILLVCLQPASDGGETLLADGRDVHARLVSEDRAAAVALCQPRTAYFGEGAGHASQVFTVHPDGRICIRLRQDGLARWRPHRPALPPRAPQRHHHQSASPHASGRAGLPAGQPPLAARPHAFYRGPAAPARAGRPALRSSRRIHALPDRIRSAQNE
ncbi:hypothetical protein GCM10010206_13150 [Streptomyces cinerochromogenes]|nr:TauD/TfdA family dioxygenase [Streptomyces cinerochromogenes]GGS52743.1 hypothetical protein GCM10010206_13150 [Streptomyces cinerochromogenes]